MSLGASYDNVVWGEMSYKPSRSQTAFQMKKSPFTSLMDGVMIINMAVILFLNTTCLVLIVVLVFVDSEVAVVFLLFFFTLNNLHILFH